MRKWFDSASREVMAFIPDAYPELAWMLATYLHNVETREIPGLWSPWDMSSDEEA
jgi:hypothetical protein